jgi:hypothetical protein
VPLPGLARLALGVTGAGWLIAVVVGFGALFRHSTEPGSQLTPPPAWPGGSAVLLGRARPTLVVFVHPHCPCTRATMAELGRIVARCRERLQTTVLFYADPSLGPDWHRTDLWDLAATIPEVTRGSDPRGRIAERFGARTSGSAVLYDPAGSLLYFGGITPARGHEGDSAGAAAIVALAHGEHASCSSAPVYGCALFEAEREG